MDTEEHHSYIRWRNGFVLRLAVFNVGLVLGFDILAIYTPELMALPISSGSFITTGISGALLIIFCVIFSAFYYSHRVNQKYSALATTMS